MKGLSILAAFLGGAAVEELVDDIADELKSDSND